MQNLKNFPCALFDMDGTLVDSMPFWHNMGRDYLRARGIEPEADLSAVLKEQTLEESARYFREHYGLCESSEQIRAGFDALIEENYKSRVPAKPGVSAYLKRLAQRGVRMSVFSSTPSRLVSLALERLGLRAYFENILESEKAGGGKRRPEAYLLALQKAGMKKEETVVYEDADFAIRSAKGAGLSVCAVYDASCRTEPETLAALADWYITSFEELLEEE